MKQTLHGFAEEQQVTIDRLRTTITKLYGACEAAEAFIGGLLIRARPGPDRRLFLQLQQELIEAMTDAKPGRIDDDLPSATGDASDGAGHEGD